jgi:hypothetical protein
MDARECPTITADMGADWVIGCSRTGEGTHAHVEPFDDAGNYAPHVVGEVTGSWGDVRLTMLVSPDGTGVGRSVVIPPFASVR